MRSKGLKRIDPQIGQIRQILPEENSFKDVYKRQVDALVINKIDLLPYVKFDMDYFRRGVAALNPGLVTFPLSCRTGEGLEAWLDWVTACVGERV